MKIFFFCIGLSLFNIITELWLNMILSIRFFLIADQHKQYLILCIYGLLWGLRKYFLWFLIYFLFIKPLIMKGQCVNIGKITNPLYKSSVLSFQIVQLLPYILYINPTLSQLYLSIIIYNYNSFIIYIKYHGKN